MSKIIAQVPTAVIVDGQRVVIQPGQTLPQLTDQDQHALLQAGAATNTAEDASEASTEIPTTKAAAKTNSKAAAMAVAE